MATWAPITSEVIDKGFGGSRGGDPINGIVIHHVAGTNGKGYVANANSRNSHPTYHIDKNGRVTGIVHPNRRPYSTGGRPDSEAVTVEIDNTVAGGDWPVSDKAINALIEIIVYHASKSPRAGKGFALNKPGVAQSEFFIAWHQQYVATACPGPYIINRLNMITDLAGKRANPPEPTPEPEPERVTINVPVPGYMNSNDAVNSSNRAVVLSPGVYYVYKENYGMLNISTKAGSPGAWVNPADFTVKPEPEPEPEPTPEPEPEPEPEPIPDESEEPPVYTPPTETPNVVIENPTARKVVRTILDVVGGLTVIAGAIDLSSPDIDIAVYTVPILAGYTAARTVFGFTVDNPNTPKVASKGNGKQVA